MVCCFFSSIHNETTFNRVNFLPLDYKTICICYQKTMYVSHTVYLHKIISFISLRKHSTKYFLKFRYNFIRPRVASKPWAIFESEYLDFKTVKKKIYMPFNSYLRVTSLLIQPLLRVLSHISPVQLCATVWTVARQAPLSMGFSRQEHWSGLSFPPPGDLPNPGIELVSLTSTCTGRRVLYHWHHLGSPN